jgi:hypothetical protein
MVLVCIWAPETDNVAFAKATGVASLIAGAFALTALIVRVPQGPVIRQVRAGTLGSTWALTALASVMIVFEIEDEIAFRFLGALGVLTASGTLALIILYRLRRDAGRTDLVTAAGEVELRCPALQAAPESRHRTEPL